MAHVSQSELLIEFLSSCQLAAIVMLCCALRQKVFVAPINNAFANVYMPSMVRLTTLLPSRSVANIKYSFAIPRIGGLGVRRWIPKTRQFIHTNRPLEFRFQCSLGSVRSRTISVVFEKTILMFFLMAMSRANKWLLTVLFTYAGKQVTETASVGVRTVYGSHFSVAFSKGKIFEAKVSTLRSMIEGASGEVTQS